MKNVKKTMALCAAILMSTVAVAQDGLSVRVGGSFPVGTFAQGNAADMALWTQMSDYGAAATGFNVGIKYQLELLSGLSAFASTDLFYSGLNEEVNETFKSDNVTLPSYMNIPVMVGANYALLDILGTTLWVEAGAGVNFRNITASEVSAAVGSLISGNTTSEYNFTTSFAWQAGIGVSLLDKISVGVHYYGLGAAEISGETTTSADLGGLLNGTTKPIEFTAGNLNPSMVVVRLGYTF